MHRIQLRAVATLALAAACGTSATPGGGETTPAVPPRPSSAKPTVPRPSTVSEIDGATTPMPQTDTVPSRVREFCELPKLAVVPSEAGARSIATTTIVETEESGIELPLRCVIRTRAQWMAFRSLASLSTLPDNVARPGEVVLAAALGGRSTTGFRIAIGPVVTRNDTAFVTVTGSSPTGASGDLVTQPLAVVRIAAPVREVVWLVRSR